MRKLMEVRLLDGEIVGGEVRFAGVNMGNAKPMTVKGYNVNNGMVVVKVPSGSHWRAHGTTVSHKGHYAVVQIEEVKAESETLFKAWTQEVLEFPLR